MNKDVCNTCKNHSENDVRQHNPKGFCLAEGANNGDVPARKPIYSIQQLTITFTISKGDFSGVVVDCVVQRYLLKYACVCSDDEFLGGPGQSNVDSIGVRYEIGGVV